MANGTLKSLLVRLGVDSKAFDKGMDRADKRSRSLQKTFTGLTKVGGAIALGAGVALAGTAVALYSTIGPASDLEEAINAVNVVFGDGAKEMIDFGEGAATAIGLSSREFNQMGAEMGAMLGNVGIAEDELAGETISLMVRASDMASIFNTDVSQAFAAIQSAIKGEFNPLEQFGVKMNQAMINAKAMEMGLADATGEISDSAKAQAALALVYEQTDKVAGDFQNTSDGLANSQRILKATLEDTKAKVGAALLPAMESLTKIVKNIASSPEFKKWLDKVIEGVGKLAAWITKTVPIMIENFRKLSAWFKDNKGVVVGILAAMGVAVLAFGISVAMAAWTALVPLLPVIAVMLAVAAVAYLVYEAWTNNWGGIQEKVAAAKEFIVNTFNNLKEKVIEIWNTLMTVLQPIIDAFTSGIEGDWYAFGENLRIAWDNLWGLVTGALTTAKETIGTIIVDLIDSVITFFTETDWGEVGLNIIKGIADGITNSIKWIKDAAKGAAKAAFDAAKGFLGIESKSKLFTGLGKNMMLGMASGITEFSKVPVAVTIGATQGIAKTAGRESGGIQPGKSSQQILDETKLARILRDLMLQVTD